MTRTIRSPTRDREQVEPGGSAPIHAEAIGKTRQRLPNGNLLLMGVPIARTGMLIYGPGEVPVKPGPDGVARVDRSAETLFSATTLGSITAAAVTDEHPLDDVTPVNWRTLSCGFALNIRRGTGVDHDVILGDLIITEQKLIALILAGKVEVSLGYDADYLDNGDGTGHQFNIIANHIAFVLRGRCGPRCAVGDAAFQPPATKGKRLMPSTAKNPAAPARRTLDRAALVEAARLRHAEELEALGGDENEGEGAPATGVPGVVNIHVSGDKPGARTTDGARLDALEAGQAKIIALLEGGKTKDTAGEGKEETKPKAEDKGKKTDDASYEDDDESDEAVAWRKARDAKTKDAEGEAADDKGKTRDSAALQTAYTGMLAQAEVLVPGFKVPTFDAAMTRHKTVDRMCATRRKVLDQAYATPSGKAIIDIANGGKPFDSLNMECGAVAEVFKAAATAKAALNNAAVTRDSATLPDLNPKATGNGAPVGGGRKVPSIAELNAAHAKFWGVAT